MTVAAVQMTSGEDVAANLATAARLLREAADAGARVAVLPENFAFMGLRDRDKLAVAERAGDGPIQNAMAALARELDLWIVAGTMPITTADAERVAPACLVFDAAGRTVARYDKIHLFDVDLPGKTESHRESRYIAPGSEVRVVDTPVGRLGLAICYDLRFPELFRRMVAEGATWFTLPSAFTVPTGRAHWEVLLRARSIENLAGMVAAGQWGKHPSGRETYGDSLVIDHWGRVLARKPAGEGVVIASFDAAAQAEVRRDFPVLTHRRL